MNGHKSSPFRDVRERILNIACVWYARISCVAMISYAITHVVVFGAALSCTHAMTHSLQSALNSAIKVICKVSSCKLLLIIFNAEFSALWRDILPLTLF
jgi:hypothetical protein